MYNTTTRSWELTDEFGEYNWIVRGADRDTVREMSDTELGAWVDGLIEHEKDMAILDIEERAESNDYPLMYYSTDDLIEDEDEYITREKAALDADMKNERQAAIDFIKAWAAEAQTGSSMMTSQEAAAALGLTPAAIRKAVQYGTLHGTKRGQMWFFERAEIERYRAEHLGRKGRRDLPQPSA